MDFVKHMSDDTCEINLSGKFTFSDHHSFKMLLATLAEGQIKKLILNMTKVDFVDSAALGILLLVRDESEKMGCVLLLRNPVGQVKKMFEISRFYDLFRIE